MSRISIMMVVDLMRPTDTVAGEHNKLKLMLIGRSYTNNQDTERNPSGIRSTSDELQKGHAPNT